MLIYSRYFGNLAWHETFQRVLCWARNDGPATIAGRRRDSQHPARMALSRPSCAPTSVYVPNSFSSRRLLLRTGSPSPTPLTSFLYFPFHSAFPLATTQLCLTLNRLIIRFIIFNKLPETERDRTECVRLFLGAEKVKNALS